MIDRQTIETNGVYTCKCCEEVIPGDHWYYDVGGDIYCEQCMDDMKHSAPYKEDLEW